MHTHGVFFGAKELHKFFHVNSTLQKKTHQASLGLREAQQVFFCKSSLSYRRASLNVERSSTGFL